MRFVAAFLLTCLICFAVVLPSSAEDARLATGIKQFNAKQYNEAIYSLRGVTMSNPQNDLARYYLAMSYQASKQYALAQAEFGYIVKAGVNPKIKQYAQQGLDSLAKLMPPAAATAASTGRVPSTKSVSSQAAPVSSANIYGPDEGAIYYQSKGSEMKVQVEINGRQVEMVLDTGAPEICIGKEQMKAAGLREPEGKPSGTTGGASNTTTVPYWDTHATVKVGPFTVMNTQVCVLESNDASPLLGQTWLKNFFYTVDQGAHCIRLRRKDKAVTQTASSGAKIPFTLRESGNRIILDVEINGKRNKVMMDTGNQAAAISFSSPQQAQQYGAPVPQDARMTTTKGVSGSGRCYAYTVSRIRCGPIEKYNADVTTDIDNQDDEEPLLGHEFFDGWQYTVDMREKVLNVLRR